MRHAARGKSGQRSEHRERAGQQQRPARADGAHQEAAARQRHELGPVAQAVVGRVRTAVEPLGDALVDERADEDVLQALRRTADDVGDEGEPDREPERRKREPEALDGDGDERNGRRRSGRHAARQRGRAQHHARRPRRHENAVAEIARAEDVRREEHLGGRRRRHEEQRHERDRDDEREDAVAEEEDDAVARAAEVRAVAGWRAPRAQDERDERDDREARGVDEERDARPATRRQRAAEERAERVAEVAGRLDPAVCRLQARVAGDRRHERELRRVGDRDAAAQQRGEREDRAGRAGEGEAGGDDGLGERDRDQRAARVEAVDEQAGGGGEQRDRRPQGDEEPCDHDPGARVVLQVKCERDHGEEVAERRQQDRGGEERDAMAVRHGAQRLGRPSRPASIQR